MISEQSELIQRIRPQMQMGEAMIILAENGTSSTPLTSFQREILLDQSPHSLAKLGLRLTYEPIGEGITIKLKAGPMVGTARFVRKRDFIDVVVEPKVGAARVFQMLEFIHQIQSLSGNQSSAFSENRTATDVILRFIIEEILAFLEKHHFRDYALCRESRSSAIRGRLLETEYIRESCPRLRFHKLPCEFFEYSQDTLENQIILSALLVAARLVSVASSAARALLRRRIALGISLLADVEAVFRDQRDIDRLIYTRRNMAFQPVHQLCRFLLSNSSVSLNPGQRVQFSSFAFNMNSVFESYIRALLGRVFGPAAKNNIKSREFKITGLEKGIRLDGLISIDGKKCVVDCKNKLVTSGEKPDFDEGEVRNADIYQVVAYALHNEIKAATAVLFYPFIGEEKFPAKIVANSEAFLGSEGLPLPLRIFLINMRSEPMDIVNWLGEHTGYFLPTKENET